MKKMTVMIIEDERMAQLALVRNIENNYPDMEVVCTASSVSESVAWLRNNSPDVIFMDVELSDGICFAIFRQVEVKATVIMTTAYDNYAVKAFEEGSADYLLKPIDPESLDRAVSRARDRARSANTPDWNVLAEALSRIQGVEEHYDKERIIVRFNDKIVPVRVSDIAYFYSEDKNNFLMTCNGSCYVVDASLDEIASALDKRLFFKISRGCIVSMGAIRSITKQFGGRLRIDANPAAPFEMTISRSRCDDFLAWLER